MDVVLLARLQFALTVMFHFIFPSVTIGLALLVAIAEVVRWRTKGEVYDRMAVFWTKLLALTFAVGVATGIVMEFEFGTNWSAYSRFVGDIFGAPLAAEAIFAFFLESSFLGVLLFGRDRVSSGVRALAAVLVALGAAMSGFWILVANSWMQTPAGYELVDGRAVMTDVGAAIFNPSTLPRLAHTVASSWVAAAFLMVGVAAYHMLRGRHMDVAQKSIALGLVVAFVGSGLMFVTGDTSARQVAATQEAKFAGMQGLYETTVGAPLVLWALPPTQDPAKAPEGPAIIVTNMLSFLSFGSFTAPVKGLNEFPTDQWPPVTLSFLAYHNMVVLGLLMFAFVLSGLFLLWRRRIERRPTWLRLAILAIPLPHLAIQLGWMTAEVGRQPWIVYGLMRTQDAVSPVVGGADIVISLVMFAGVYALLFALWLYLMAKEIRHGPAPAPEAAVAEATGGPGRPTEPALAPAVGTGGR
jgi:cytochrome d ubiquinol oxidase subunit I